MDTIMIDVFLIGGPRVAVTFIKRSDDGDIKKFKPYSAFPSSLPRLAAWCRHSQNVHTGRVIPFSNGWSWMKKSPGGI